MYPRPFIKLYRVRLFINPSSVRQRCQYQWHAAHVDTPAHIMSLDAFFNSTCEPADRASKLVGGLHGAAPSAKTSARGVAHTNGTPTRTRTSDVPPHVRRRPRRIPGA